MNEKSESLVTVLMPVYNMEPWISRALDSVLASEVDFAYEILVIDDCSTDKSADIAEEYARKNPGRVKVIRNEKNLKLPRNSLKGYRLIKTKYWAVLDPDDYWTSKTKMKSAIDFLESHPDYTLYATNALIKSPDGERLVDENAPKSLDYGFSNIFFTHTSATFFRNVFDGDDLDRLEKNIGTKSENMHRGDGWRDTYHAFKGRCRFENRTESVYVFHKTGIWSRMTEYQQKILNARNGCDMFEYFGGRDGVFLLEIAFISLYRAISLVPGTDSAGLEELGELSRRCFSLDAKLGVSFLKNELSKIPCEVVKYGLPGLPLIKVEKYPNGAKKAYLFSALLIYRKKAKRSG